MPGRSATSSKASALNYCTYRALTCKPARPDHMASCGVNSGNCWEVLAAVSAYRFQRSLCHRVARAGELHVSEAGILQRARPHLLRQQMFPQSGSTDCLKGSARCHASFPCHRKLWMRMHRHCQAGIREVPWTSVQLTSTLSTTTAAGGGAPPTALAIAAATAACHKTDPAMCSPLCVLPWDQDRHGKPDTRAASCKRRVNQAGSACCTKSAREACYPPGVLEHAVGSDSPVPQPLRSAAGAAAECMLAASRRPLQQPVTEAWSFAA